MNRYIFVLAVILCSYSVNAQITSPAIKANFGVDADLRANFYNSFVNAGNDDWFQNNPGPGIFVIDTTGAAYILQQYSSNPSSRMFPFFRGMRYPQFSVQNDKLLVDAVMIRDHHGDDSTVFASGSNKNAQHPGAWTTPISQGIPDKNDILDMFMHVRHDGPSLNDSLWLFGGVSLDAITGNRYFDFEMYQTDITYNRSTLSFIGFGPDEGHTSWKFDASGNLLAAGDIIFTAEYSSSSLSMLQARIWIHKNDLLITPAAFSWGGDFDGASSSSNYGYASIVPKVAGNFYTGTQCANNTWPGPFGLVLQNNALATNYSARQFMEFSVNLSKLGLDYIIDPSDPCAMPFRRILVKSRSSTSFNAELKDFVGPFDFFRAPRASASASIPFFCGSVGHSEISVNNPLPTSLYTWNTPDGHIIGSTVGPSISVDQPGTYIVNQQLMDSCGVSYARDTVVVYLDNNCTLLPLRLTRFTSKLSTGSIELQWKVNEWQSLSRIEVQRRVAGKEHESIAVLPAGMVEKQALSTFIDRNLPGDGEYVTYRLKLYDRNGNISYSNELVHRVRKADTGFNSENAFTMNRQGIYLDLSKSGPAEITVFDLQGRVVDFLKVNVTKGTSYFDLKKCRQLISGVYVVKVSMNNEIQSRKIILN